LWSEAVKKFASDISGAKALNEKKAITAALKRCATPNQNFPANFEALPVPSFSNRVLFPKLCYFELLLSQTAD
jgi:hypothetical protein